LTTVIDIDHEIALLQSLCHEVSLTRREKTRTDQLPVATALRALDFRDLPPRHVSIIQAAEKKPRYWAIRLQAREVGWMLYCKGGTDLMRDACDRVGDSRFEAALDKWWDGVGFRTDRRGVWVA
jgi:hypothetical protein